MKKKIHPPVNPAIFIDSSCGAEFITTSTLTSDETRDIDGITYQIIRTEISSASHPFYTGKQVLVDTARRVEKFQEKLEKQKSVSAARKGKKIKRAKARAGKNAKIKKSAAARKNKKNNDKKENA